MCGTGLGEETHVSVKCKQGLVECLFGLSSLVPVSHHVGALKLVAGVMAGQPCDD